MTVIVPSATCQGHGRALWVAHVDQGHHLFLALIMFSHPSWIVLDPSDRRESGDEAAFLGAAQSEVAAHSFTCVEEIYSYCVRTKPEELCDLGGLVTAAAESEDFLLAGG